MTRKTTHHEREYCTPSSLDERVIDELIGADSKWKIEDSTHYRIGKYPNTVEVAVFSRNEIKIAKVQSPISDLRGEDLASRLEEEGFSLMSTRYW
ncbi:hypothetical protein JW868_04660 [Candidatus Woesearchaeota archaeon]|nr:hypothetical protein [Candidatus Woesearchaeota archaeon]